MKTNKILKRLVVLVTTFIIIFSSANPSFQEVFASEEYSLELFNQLAEKVTSLYYKEAMVGLEVLDEIYSDPNLQINIEKQLEKDQETKSYLLERGFDHKKIGEIIQFIDDIFPSIEDMKNEEDKNIIKRLIKTTLVEENGTLSFKDYDESIKQFGKGLYEILPVEASDIFDQYFETEEEKIDAMIKITIEFIYSGHGRVIYNESTEEYDSLKLMISDDFIENVNNTLNVKILNENSRKSINIFLSGLEDTIEVNELCRVYTDISLVLNLVGIYNNLPREASVGHTEEIDITRPEILREVLEFLELEPMEYTEEFTDVKADDFYSGYIAKAKNIGIINGYKDNTFKPMAKVTSSEAVSIISRALDYKNGKKDLSKEQTDDILKSVKHNGKIEIWARESVAKLIMSGIIPNDYSGEFGKEVFITREEVKNIISKIKM